MAKGDLFRLGGLRGSSSPLEQPDDIPVAAERGARAETMQRLQVGLSGLAAMVLLVGLANIIQDRARIAEEHSVPEAASTVAPSTSSPLSDPLADAGVVPDMPEPSPTPMQPLELTGQSNGSNTPTP